MILDHILSVSGDTRVPALQEVRAARPHVHRVAPRGQTQDQGQTSARHLNSC